MPVPMITPMSTSPTLIPAPFTLTSSTPPLQSSITDADYARYILFDDNRQQDFAELLAAEDEFLLKAPTEAKAGEALFACLHSSLHSKPTPVILGVSIENCSLHALLNSVVHIEIGSAIGQGPEQSAWSNLVECMIKNSRHWLLASGDYYFLRLQDLPWSEDDFVLFETYGFVLGVMLLRKHPSLPVSPHLLPLLLCDYETAVHETLISTMSPNAFQRLQTWPPTNVADLNLTTDPMIMLIDYLNLELPFIQDICTTSEQSHAIMDHISHQLKNVLLFSKSLSTPQDLMQHPVLVAVQKGFDRVFPTTSKTKMFFQNRHTAISVFKYMYNTSLISDPNQVISRLSILSSEEQSSLEKEAFEALFLRSVSRFLQGHGKPDNNVPYTAELPSSTDVMHRSRRLLMAMTGTEFIQSASSKLYTLTPQDNTDLTQTASFMSAP
ncbi:hypothetical protein C0989_006017 [Termitomyces sp. Mn162]|nr:hypothetical protein C0989_006017 [Termitomyces sp. Mn162]